MRVEKRGNSYRVRKTYKGTSYTLTFDHKPSSKEITLLLAEKMNSGVKGSAQTFESCLEKYIESRSNLISPATTRSYNSIKRALSDEFKKKNIFDITQLDVQNETNEYAKTRAPKTVANMHGLISSVFDTFRPSMVINTTLPKKKPSRAYKPTENDVYRLLEAAKGTYYSIPFQLGVLGLRRGEIAALNFEDLEGNILHVTKDMVESENKGAARWVIKDMPKTDTSYRDIYLPDSLVEEIKKAGTIYERTPPMLLQTIHVYQDKLKIPQFRFHDLRHYFASYAHAKGIPDVYIMQMGGWKSTYTLNKIYKEAMEDQILSMQQQISGSILSPKSGQNSGQNTSQNTLV